MKGFNLKNALVLFVICALAYVIVTGVIPMVNALDNYNAKIETTLDFDAE